MHQQLVQPGAVPALHINPILGIANDQSQPS